MVEKINTIVSKTKPGPGWIQVTPEILDMFEEIALRSEERRAILLPHLEEMKNNIEEIYSKLEF